MHGTDETVRVRPATGIRASLVVATAASAAAGLLHAVAAGSHGDERTLVVLFSLCAIAQVCWAGAAVVRPVPGVLFVGVVINGGAFVVWVLTRTTGIQVVDALADPEAVSVPDAAAATFAALSVIGVAFMLARPRGRVILTPAFAALGAALLMVAAVPAMSASHGHGGAGHGHGGTAGDDHEHGDAAELAGHAHGEDEGDDDAHTDGEDHAHDAADPDHPHDPADPNHPHDPADPNHPQDPADPNHPHDPADPNHPHDPADPSDPNHPHDPAEPSDPNHPHDPTDPADPSDPNHPHSRPARSSPSTTRGSRPSSAPTRRRCSTHPRRHGPVPTVDAVRAAGYTSIGDASTGFEHFVNSATSATRTSWTRTGSSRSCSA